MSRREEFLKENMVDDLDAYGNKIGRCLTEIYFEGYDKAVISDYKESLVGKDVNEYLKSKSYDLDQTAVPINLGNGNTIYLDDAEEACAMVADKYERLLENMISKKDAKRALCKSLGCNPVHSCDKCAAVQKFLNQLNK